MDARTLRALHGARRLTLDELRATNPELAAIVAGRAGKNVRADQPIGAIPELGGDLAAAGLGEVIALSGLDEAAAAAIAQVASSPARLDDGTLAALVAAQKLSAAQAGALGFTSALYQLTGQDTALVGAIRGAKLARLGGRAPTSTADLARLTPADWTAFLSASGAQPPAGTTTASMGAALAGRFAALHPGIAFGSRLPPADPAGLLLWLADPATHRLELDGLDRAYPGLGLAAVIGDPALSAQAKVAAVAHRVSLVQQAAARLGDVRLHDLDLNDGSPDLSQLGLGAPGATPEEQAMVLGTMRAYQRAFALARSVDDGVQLVGRGFSSALSIGTLPLAEFQQRSGFAPAQARALWRAARSGMADVALTAGALLDHVQGGFGQLGMSNQPPPSRQYLQQLAGFEELFGSLSFCACQECQSIVGPAAYFVDLMKFIDENLRNQLAGLPGHPLDLRVRRPDLWTLELSCDNTNDLVPTLDLVNEILENYAAGRLGYAGSLADRPAIAALVYEATLARRVDSFQQPFHLPLARIDSYLRELGHRRADVARALGAAAPAFAQAELGLSVSEVRIITTAVPDIQLLGHVYGLSFGGAPAAVDRVDAQSLASAMGLDRAGLGALVSTAFVGAGGAHPRIVTARRSSDSVQDDVEWVEGLTGDALDRMHRFTRLVKRSGLAIADLDLLLTTLGDATLGPAPLVAVGLLHALQARFGLPVDVLCALVGPLPQVPPGSSLLDRLFNTPSLLAADGAYPRPAARFVHPAFRQSTAAPADPALPRLLAGLGVDLDGLAALARHLAPHLAQEARPGFDPAAPDEDDRYFVLSAPNLSRLFRHARLAQLLGLSVEDLFQLLGLVGLDQVEGPGDLAALLEAYDLWRATGDPLDDLAVATGQAPRDASRYPDPASVADGLVTAAATGASFADTVFAVALGTTEQGSRDLMQANPALVEAAAGGLWRLRAGIDLDAAVITVPPSATVSTPPAGARPVQADEVREALRPYLAAEVLVRGLGTALGLPVEKVVALVALLGVSLTADGLVRAVRGDGPAAPLVALIAGLRPLAVALAAPAWDASAIAFLAQHRQLFGAAPLPQTATSALHPTAPFFDLDQLRALSTYARLAAPAPVGASTAPIATPADVQSALLGFDAAGRVFPAATDAALARVLRVPSGLVVGLRGRVTLPPTSAPALDQLSRAAALALELGLGGDGFGGLVSDDYGTLSQAADALSAALTARYTDEATRVAKLDEAEQPVRAARRDALADHLLHSLQPRLWSAVDDLYAYFLIDVAAGGCATTSRVVAATASAQLYVHRALMNLERDQLPPGDPRHVAVQMPEEAAAEWDWRQNYRVWQANRQVFLWPENYLDPDLRDDKTPLFQDLESNLLQTDVTDQNVLDAYTQYVAGLEEVASLVIAGAYHDVGDAREDQASLTGVGDVLHLFGVTAGDPPTYYYRTCQNLIASARDPGTAAVWSPWQKIAVQITGRRVAPLVHRGRLYVFWVDTRTRPASELKDGASTFTGYRHQLTLSFTTLRPDATWTPPQSIQLPADLFFGPSSGQVDDPLQNGVALLDPQRRKQAEPLDDYGLSGPNWDSVWPESRGSGIQLALRDFLTHVDVDLFRRQATNGLSRPVPQVPRLLCARNASAQASVRPLFDATPGFVFWSLPGHANLIIDEARLDVLGLDYSGAASLKDGLYTEKIAELPLTADLLAVVGSEEDGLVQIGSDVLLLQGSVLDDRYVLRRIGTTLVEDVARRLFEDGVDGLLDTETQLALAEAGLPITLVGNRIEDHTDQGTVDFAGPYGVYYRELYLHIPCLVANALNARGSYESARRWYQYVFDPTACEVIDTRGVPADEVAHRLLDRVWRYREFRGLDVDALRQVLTDPAALALYQQDPFNPWAIARQRLGALQKAVVMRYVDNLLDWGDSLFSQFTTESVNEAEMLYVMASDVLGPRPAELGECGAGLQPMTYEKIGPLVDGSSEILVEMESWLHGNRLARLPRRGSNPPQYGFDPAALAHALARTPVEAGGAGDEPPFRGLGWDRTPTASWAPALASARIKTRDRLGGRTFSHAWRGDVPEWIGRFGFGIIRQLTPAFCAPANADLLAYWDHVADRLFKIRNCMDLDGNQRTLALLAPAINPMQLVAMKAAGLSLEDVLGASTGDLPPYRFLYLIDRAKAFAASLSGFGAALLNALEKKDGEELDRLRLSQQMNLAQLTSQTRQLEIQAASESLEALHRQRDAAQYRSDYYAGLLSSGRNAWEFLEEGSRVAATLGHSGSSLLAFGSAILKLLPQIGSPVAMKYGGQEVGGSAHEQHKGTFELATVSEGVAASAALEASLSRRTEGWQNQQELAGYDVDSLDRQIKAAEIRLDIANRALDLHQRGIDQLQELLDFTDQKFTNLGLFTWVSSQVQRLYRGAYQNALALAKLAEQAYRFERGDDTLPALAASYWDPTHAGLLAGEQLLMDLQTLERRYLETNYRMLEVDQPFALSQVDPTALVALRQTGECTFTLSEVFFDLFYPGHYKRRIRAVRLTIPCITGPYVNVGATLELEQSWLRATPAPGAPLAEVPPSRSVCIATSTAQNDAGVFELSFRDERYMPFEGLGAVSQWRLTLPKAFRQFDYQTINDVILSISYTAERDGALRDRVEASNAALEGAIVTFFTRNPARRLFSLRQDFSSAFTRLLRSPARTPAKIEIADRNLPLYLQGRNLVVERGVALLRTAAGLAPAGFQLGVDGAVVDAFSPDPTLGDLPSAPLPGAFTASLRGQHTLSVEAPGSLAPATPVPGDASAVDAALLLDVLLYVEYRLA